MAGQLQAHVPIYANGSFLSTWHDTSVGCLRCNFSDVARRRNGSASSLSATVAPWGALTWSSVSAYPADSVLDFWARGSGLTAVSVFIRDQATKTDSRDVRFSRADQLPSAVTILGSDDDGWIHIRIDLKALDNKDNNASASASPPASASSCSAGVSRFDRIVISDISGMGFNLVLDDVQLTSPGVFAAASLPVLQPETRRVPVFNEDLTTLFSGKNRFLMKLKSTATYADASAICNELAGAGVAPEARRFAGVCHTPLSALAGGSAVASSPLAWRLATISVKTTADLATMREALADKVEWFERDLTAFTTIRSLQQAFHASSATQYVEGAKDQLSTYTQEGCNSDLPWLGSDRCRQVDGDTGNATTTTGSGGLPEIPAVGGLLSVPAANMTNATAAANATSGPSSPSPAPGGELVPTAAPSPSVNIIKPAPIEKDEVAHTQPIDEDGLVGSEDVATLTASVPWGLDRVDQVNLPLDGAYSSGDYDGRGVHVYILDTGLRASHYDFRGRVGDGASAVGSSVDDDAGHGSHVAGIAVGSIHGVARSATLHPVKVVGSDGSASYSNIIAGIQWVKDHKARNRIASAVISMSLAGPRSAALNDAVEAATAAGITVVTAAGNNKGGDSCTMSPCSAPSSITVGSSTNSDAMSSFSNIGRCLSVFAPGSIIASAGISSDGAEVLMSGTSMAAPHVTGVAALYLQYRPGASPAEVKAAIRGAAVSKFFEGSSPQALLNAMSSRLRAAGPQVTQPPPAQQPVVVVAPKASPSPSPKPAAPAPAPAPMPAPSLPMPTFPMSKSFCASCPWCMFC